MAHGIIINGSNLRRLRSELMLTQEELGRAVGTGSSNIRRMENLPATGMGVKVLRGLSLFLKVSREELLARLCPASPIRNSQSEILKPTSLRGRRAAASEDTGTPAALPARAAQDFSTGAPMKPADHPSSGTHPSSLITHHSIQPFGRWLSSELRRKRITTATVAAACQVSRSIVRLWMRSRAPELRARDIAHIAPLIDQYPAEIHDRLRAARAAERCAARKATSARRKPPTSAVHPSSGTHPSSLITHPSIPSLLSLEFIPIIRCSCGSPIPYQTIHHAIPADNPGDTQRITHAWCPVCDRAFRATSILRCATWLPTQTEQLEGPQADEWRARLKARYDPAIAAAA